MAAGSTGSTTEKSFLGVCSTPDDRLEVSFGGLNFCKNVLDLTVVGSFLRLILSSGRGVSTDSFDSTSISEVGGVLRLLLRLRLALVIGSSSSVFPVSSLPKLRRPVSPRLLRRRSDVS